jgi:hypothetical protein
LPSTINASNSGFGGIVSTGDSSGELQLQTAGTTAVTINTSQRAAFVAGTAAAPAITTAGDTNTGMFFPAADTIAFAEGGAESMRIDSAGNVGIGTTTPAATYSAALVSKPAAALAALALDSASGNNTGINWYNNGSLKWATQVLTTNEYRFFDFTASAERMRIDNSGNLLFNSGYGSVATAYGCRAWVNFNGTGTPAIRASGNVSSITDNGTGEYTINFSTSMPDANYGISAINQGDSNGGICPISNNANPATGSVRIQSRFQGGGLYDSAYVCVTVFR